MSQARYRIRETKKDTESYEKSEERDTKQHKPGPQQSTAELGYLDAARVYVDGKYSQAGSELICCICHNVLWKPVACATCENAFCGGCIRTWTNIQKLSKQVTCPFNCKFQEKRAPPILNSFLSKLKIYCAYTTNGCREVPSYDALEKHEETCSYEKTPCRICQTPVSRRDPNNKHEVRKCFQQMYDRDPDYVQAQFIQLLDIVEASQRRIQALEKLLGVEPQKNQ